MSDLIQRLRNGPAPLDDPNLNDEAADAIARLTAERDAARADERERCAKLCERTKSLGRDGWPTHYSASECAAAIRAIGNGDKPSSPRP
jgi:hypothetical protein